MLKSTKLSIKNLQFSKGHTTHEPSMSCTLYINGKRAATVIDDSLGGELQIKILNPKVYTISYNDVVENIHKLVNNFETHRQTKASAKKNIVVREIGKKYADNEFVMFPYMPTQNNINQVQAMNKYVIWNINEAW